MRNSHGNEVAVKPITIATFEVEAVINRCGETTLYRQRYTGVPFVTFGGGGCTCWCSEERPALRSLLDD